MKEWLSKVWKWLAAGLAVAVVTITAFFLGRRRRSGEIDLAVAEHELKRTQAAGKAAEAKVAQLSAKQREIAKDILVEKAKRAGLETEWEKLDVEEINRRLRALGLLK